MYNGVIVVFDSWLQRTIFSFDDLMNNNIDWQGKSKKKTFTYVCGIVIYRTGVIFTVTSQAKKHKQQSL